MAALVAAGAVPGTAARYGLSLHWPTSTGGWPWATFTVNLSGALVLGFLLEALARRGPDVGRRRRLRLALGTGFLGAFTTYSSLATEADLLVHAAAPALAVGYGLVSVVGGVLAALGGVALAAGHHRRTLRRPPGAPDLDDGTRGPGVAR